MAISKAMAITSLVLRVLTLLLVGASIVLFATDKITLSDGTKATFKNVLAYRFVIATGILGFLYALFQIPFALYSVCTGKRMIRNDCIPEFDFYGDKIIALLLASGVGAGFGVTFELKKILHDFFKGIGVDPDNSKLDHFLDRGNIATGLLFLALLFMATLSVLSSINRNTNTTTTRGFFSR